MNKFQARIGREMFGLEPDTFAAIVDHAERNGFDLDWSEATNAEIRRWFRDVTADIQRVKAGS